MRPRPRWRVVDRASRARPVLLDGGHEVRRDALRLLFQGGELRVDPHDARADIEARVGRDVLDRLAAVEGERGPRRGRTGLRSPGTSPEGRRHSRRATALPRKRRRACCSRGARRATIWSWICALLIDELSAKSAGSRPMRMSMMRPTPFWPSFCPWAKLTPLQVEMRMARIHPGGDLSASAGARMAGNFAKAERARSSSTEATPNPKKGETISDMPTSWTLCQLTPEPKTWPGMSELARPTPTMAPMRVCELEAGRPNHQVPGSRGSPRRGARAPWPGRPRPRSRRAARLAGA